MITDCSNFQLSYLLSLPLLLLWECPAALILTCGRVSLCLWLECEVMDMKNESCSVNIVLSSKCEVPPVDDILIEGDYMSKSLWTQDFWMKSSRFTTSQNSR